MSLSQRVKELESLLPNVKVSKFSDSFKSLNAKQLHFSLMPTTEVFKYYLNVSNPIHMVETVGGNVTSVPVVSVVVRRYRNKTESTLAIASVGAFDSATGFPVTVSLPKASVQKNDRIYVDFIAPNAKTVTHSILIIA